MIIFSSFLQKYKARDTFFLKGKLRISCESLDLLSWCINNYDKYHKSQMQTLITDLAWETAFFQARHSP